MTSKARREIVLLGKTFDAVSTPCMVLPFLADEKPLKGINGMADWRMNGAISRQLEAEHLQGSHKEIVLVPSLGRLPIDNFVMVGLGGRSSVGKDVFHQALERMLEVFSKAKVKDFVLSLNALLPAREQADWLGEFAEMQDRPQVWTALIDVKEIGACAETLRTRYSKNLDVRVAIEDATLTEHKPFTPH